MLKAIINRGNLFGLNWCDFLCQRKATMRTSYSFIANFFSALGTLDKSHSVIFMN